jgi:ElaB/YqjD/DUF883 family membrane-anchored ribosome-binding protein
MIDLDVLKKRGCSPEQLATVFKKFDLDVPVVNPDDTDRHTKLCNLRNRIRTRIQSGRDWNFANYKTYHALDLAWNTPFRQISPTLLQTMVGSDAESTDIKDKLKSFGFDLDSVVESYTDPKSGKLVKRVNAPAFYMIMVPLMRSYVTMRWAKIINDRRVLPFFKYEPVITTKKNKVRCEILTNRVQVMATQMGYFEIMKQSVFQMLHYGICLQFPSEEWWTESQLREMGGDTEEEVTVREGIRYHMPHPARMFWDQAYRVSTFNSDTGCEYAGYWRVLRYRDIMNNPAFFNTNKVAVGTTDWWSAHTTYFQTVFRGCTMSWPPVTKTSEGNNDREERLSFNYYNSGEMGDMSCTLTEYYEKLIPKDNGLGDYEHPVWFRFVVAGDTATIVYVAPVPYCPILAYVYDADENRDTNASLSLECLPFQDQFSNLLTQYLLSVQQNLSNTTFLDKDQIEEGDLQKIENAGARLWQGRTFVRFSSRKTQRAQQQTPNAVYSAQFQQLDTQSILQAMKVLLDTLERVLVMSAQEVAQAASHEQTREEVRQIAGSGSTRLTFTETPVDLAGHAWKKQIYQGLMGYGSEDVYSYVAYDKPITKELLTKELGFTVDEEDDEKTPNRRVYLSAPKKKLRIGDGKTAIMLEAFAAQRDNADRVNDTEAAIALLQLIAPILSSEYGIALGADQLFEIVNQAGRRSGVFDRDFKLKVKLDPTDIMKKRMENEAEAPARAAAGGQPQQQPGPTPDELMMILKQVQEQIMQEVGNSIKPVGEAIEKIMAMVQEQGSAIQQIGEATAQNTQDIASIGNAMKSLETAIMNEPAPMAPSPAPMYEDSTQAAYIPGA